MLTSLVVLCFIKIEATALLIQVEEMSRVNMKSISLKDVLSHTAFVTSFFNSGIIAKNSFTRFLEKVLFLILFCGLSFIAILAVFARKGIDTWIQFSLYIIPLLAMICGHIIFKSKSFKEILKRRLTRNDSSNSWADKTNVHLIKHYLKTSSIRTCLYPISLVLYQWIVYIIFFKHHGSSNFSGPHNISLAGHLKLAIEEKTWLPLYYAFWTLAMYITGFVACSFLLVVRIHMIDVKYFLCRMGDGPVIQKFIDWRFTPERKIPQIESQEVIKDGVSLTPVGLFVKVISFFTGFLTLGLVELDSSHLEANQILTSRLLHYEENENGEFHDSGYYYTGSLIVATEGSHEVSSGADIPREASREISELVGSLELNSSKFKPFLVVLTFFSVTSLVTHVVAMLVLKSHQFTVVHWWTLVRSLFWFLLALRLLWTVAMITNTLSLIIPHIHYLRSVGRLRGNKQDWDEFFDLIDTFHLGSKTYGFPLTLNQVASIVAVVNFSFLIVLSLLTKK
ncbi:uncharacterized protein LOC124439473 [Xenia sp. Carnegie-2017]|uniref:uncharacterized protein LOC124439473 n=1 Tax=Xenia sp. Carnegie-2017 TaxID=2897299 RepID=UPI001F032E3E|nr:uncharacterized protein LOC124439473 [Xenia sp. Carnegie-2017]